MNRPHSARAVCLIIVAILAGTPILAATCEWTCSHPGETSHHSSAQTSHHHHDSSTYAETDGMSATLKAVHAISCCGDTGLSAAATVGARTDGKVLPSAVSLVPAAAARVHTSQPAFTAPVRGAPPGGVNAARPLPLRI